VPAGGVGGLEVARGLGDQMCYTGVGLGDDLHQPRARQGNMTGRLRAPVTLGGASSTTGASGLPLPSELKGKSGRHGPCR
jgi:hypothetical protein